MKLVNVTKIVQLFTARKFEKGEYICEKTDGSLTLLKSINGGLYTEQGQQFLNIYSVKKLHKITDREWTEKAVKEEAEALAAKEKKAAEDAEVERLKAESEAALKESDEVEQGDQSTEADSEESTDTDQSTEAE